MRRALTFTCEGARMAATLDEAAGSTGLLIVSGGNEIRVGAHRGMAMLAADIAGAGHPVFRFDRRGIGDSEGHNGGFMSSSADISSAVAAFRTHCPDLKRVIAFGNCDAASAIVMHQPAGLDGAVIANVWIIEAQDELPPAAAIKARYAERLKDPRSWVRLFTGAVDLRKLAGGLFKMAAPQAPASLPGRVADGIASFPGPLSILLAERDGTALAFAGEWKGSAFETARNRADLSVRKLDSASHSFANDPDYAALKSVIISALAR